MLNIKIIFLTLLIIPNIIAQTKIDSSSYIFGPSPVIGWDSLKKIIERPDTYAEIPRKAGMIGKISLKIEVDSTGNLLDAEPFHIIGLDTLFVPPVANILKSIKWIPSSFNHKRINNYTILTFTFYTYSPTDSQSFIISAPSIDAKGTP